MYNYKKKKSETSTLKETLEKGMLRKEVPFSHLTRCSFMTFEQSISSVRIKGYKILHVYIYTIFGNKHHTFQGPGVNL